LALALDEPKDSDEKFEFGEIKFVVEKSLLESSGGVSIDFMEKGFASGYKIEPKIPIKKPAGGDADDHCGSCSC
jgi:Fe-S cluster assembly iron-binding protein IscA